LDEWRLIDTKLKADAELDAAEWHAAPVKKVAPMEKAVGAMERVPAASGMARWR
jgi:hypothetical protein